MKNYILKIIWSLIIISIMGVSDISIVPSKITYAKELTSVTNDEEVESKLNSLYDYINTMKSDVELINELDPISYVKSYIETGEGNLSFSTILNAIISLFFREVKTILSLAFSIVAIGIICSLFKNIQSSFSGEGVSQVAFYACYAILIILLSCFREQS